MSYFQRFNYVLYPNFEYGGNYLILKNITSRVIKSIPIVDDNSIFYNYVMSDGERIEDVAYNIYGRADLYWVLMLVNNRYDRFYDFVLSSEELTEFIIEKYGSLSGAATTYKYYIFIDAIGDYIETTLLSYNEWTDPKKVVSNYDNEIIQNESKRTLSILQKNYVDGFVDDFGSLISR